MAWIFRCFKKCRKDIRVLIAAYILCVGFCLGWLALSYSTMQAHGNLPRNSDKQYMHDVYTQALTPSIGMARKTPSTPKRRISNEPVSSCGGYFNYGNILGKLYNVVIDPRYCKGRKGGENITDVISQKEADEYYTLQKGFFTLQCTDELKGVHVANKRSLLYKWLSALRVSDSLAHVSTTVPAWTILIERRDYANLCMSMGAFYNAFSAIRLLNLEPNETNVVFVDGHPNGALDSTWDVLFGNITRIGQLTEPVLYKNLVWNTLEYDSPLLDKNLPSVPYIEEFRQFFLGGHRITSEKVLDCKNLTVLLIWRRDYLAHPRNPAGHVSRKIKNEEELEKRTKEQLPGHVVNGLQLDTLTMRGQLEVIANTDIVIAMHGAGLTHTLFLPKHAGLIEMFPRKWSGNNRFMGFCKWRGLHYSSWKNNDPRRELEGDYMIVDVGIVMKYLSRMQEKICMQWNVTETRTLS